MKPLEENIEEWFHDIGFGYDFLGMSPKEKLDKLAFFKIEIFLISKEIMKKVRSQSTKWDEKSLQIIFLIELNGMELPGNTLKLSLKLLGSVAKVTWWSLLIKA